MDSTVCFEFHAFHGHGQPLHTAAALFFLLFAFSFFHYPNPQSCYLGLGVAAFTRLPTPSLQEKLSKEWRVAKCDEI